MKAGRGEGAGAKEDNTHPKCATRDVEAHKKTCTHTRLGACVLTTDSPIDAKTAQLVFFC